MGEKIGRNDPCPCGSGRKFKQCCGNTGVAAAEQQRKDHAGAVDRALDWLANKHRKAVSVAIDAMLCDNLSEEEQEALRAQDQETWHSIQINATEWLIAEGHIHAQGKHKRVAEYLLGRGGPLFTVEQRSWLEQLAERPLRLYDVTDVVAGRQMTLCDSLDGDASSPIVVQERLGSQAARPGIQVGARIMEVDGHYELSGAAYPFSPLVGPGVLASLRERVNRYAGPRQELPGLLSFIIRRAWLAQFCATMPLPSLMDAYSNQPILLITDHYRVQDWAALTQALSAQGDIEGNRESGWSRLIDCEDGQSRPVATVNAGTSANKISLFYKTQAYADQGRPWFDSLAGPAVQFVSRELSDPAALMRRKPGSQEARRTSGGPDLSPEALADLIEGALLHSYANWADEPIPALDGKTPRQAIASPAGLERVRGLLRMYQVDEEQAALQQGRRVISFEFLWRTLGIAP
mgnify:CR=1 FL=1